MKSTKSKDENLGATELGLAVEAIDEDDGDLLDPEAHLPRTEHHLHLRDGEKGREMLWSNGISKLNSLMKITRHKVLSAND